MFVKVCGLRSADDVRVALEAGADAVGFVLHPASPRYVEPEAARELVALVPEPTLSVVVVAEHTAADAARLTREIGADVLQLHGRYTAQDFAVAAAEPVRLWRATSLADGPDLHVGTYGEEVLLLDSPRAGSGETWDVESLDPRPDGHWLLAGGLTPDNVADAVRRIDPWGVDVSSGVESTRGVKDHARIAAFVAAARSVHTR
ncbi:MULTISPECIES: phosphoribosylanthranilate isomerase [Pseudonocardia]|uniref:N-(5'-phosphoribosyl)anthranilate isomerase n=2 Tax=Pseudonocardia TaxID=1847 RepID=A0A1Y2MZL0_PSEAH|nr:MULTISPECIES: phosphoribosylanthranilate isomerase [Pseudonocardia]OSY40088.1 N-(5'-phosphoribosyl)anthranilate isomerase [Pseudonocardia autotrophica]TDN72966.1 phosphoribosylanthranilate isomerase [Pseudonocardia autotrophica]BBG03686.1 N-(5'-phosphoribosyl)anthranilate isomerase [Pseudonocardia autotrophica]GEC29207.1 N-(5'-phosphoribosyl)anthranilate isomerase [Pseudonocardia saturnea]